MNQSKQKIILVAISSVLVVFILWLMVFNQPDPLKVDVSNIDVNIDIERFEKDLFSQNGSIEKKVDNLEKKYPKFFPLFTQKIISIGHTGKKDFYKYFEAFIEDYTVENAKEAVNKEFNNIEDIEKQLTYGFKHYKYYYPDKTIPKIVTFIGGFNHSVVTTDSLIGIGLDKYLGKDHEFYGMMKIPAYAARKMTREQIPVDCMKAWAKKEFQFKDTSNYLVHKMIHQGKIICFLDAMFPEMPDSLKLGFSEKDLGFCSRFEQKMWQKLVNEELLFSTDYLKHRKYLGEAPFTAGFGKKSPGRAAVWIGWQIVKKYVQKNNIKFTELMKETDYQKILNQSSYQP